MLMEQAPRWLTQLTPVESEESKHERRKRRAYLACDLLLAKLYKNHPDHAMAALMGVKPNVIDLEPPPAPEPLPTAEIIPLPVNSMMEEMIGRCPTVPMIMNAVCEFYRVHPLDVCSSRRTMDVLIPRQIVMYLAKILTTNALTTIGHILGKRDHTTVLHAVRKTEKAVMAGGRLADEIEVLKLHIKAAAFKSV